MVMGSNLSWPGLQVCHKCTLEGQAWYVNVRGSVHWKGVYRVGDRDLGVQNFFFGF